MIFFDLVKISIRNLLRNPIRTFLTMFAVIIGGILITIVFTVVNGVEKFFNMQFETFSDKRFLEVRSSKFDISKFLSSRGFGNDKPQEVKDDENTSFMPQPFKDDDIKKIKEVPGVEQLFEWVSINAKSINLKGDEKKYQVGLQDLPLFMQEKVELVAGRYVAENETGKIVVGGQFIEVWGFEKPEDAIGKKVEIVVEPRKNSFCPPGCQSIGALQNSEDIKENKIYEFEIVGVTEKTIMSTFAVVSQKDTISMVKFIRGTDDVLTNKDSSRFIAMVLVDKDSNVRDVEKKIESFGFDAQTYDEQKNQIGQILDILKYFLSTFGIIAMAVASLSIINTLFMAIYERTREIGISKAVGASNFDILIQFTIEAMLIGALGGLIGLGAGYIIATIFNFVLHGGISFLSSFAILKSYESLNVNGISIDLLVTPVLAIVISTIAGLIPAYKASRLNPVESLRYE